MGRLLIHLPLVLALSLSALTAKAEGVQTVEIEISGAATERVDYSLDITAGRSNYRLEAPEDRGHFDSLPAPQKQAFREKRASLLGRVAKALHSLRYGFGTGSIVKDKLLYVYRATTDSLFHSRIREFSPEIQSLLIQGRENGLGARRESEARAAERAELTAQARSEAIVVTYLKAVDRTLWQQAPLVAHANEFGFVGSAGLQMLGGQKDARGYGGLLDIGLSVGFNFETKSVAFQVFRDFERYQSTMMPVVFVAGVVAKAGFYISNQKPGELGRQGTSFYPPGIPGYSSMTPNSFQTGLSTGLTVPPSPLGDVMTYTNHLNYKTIVRVNISPLQRGFVRVETGLDRKSLVSLISPLEKAINSVRTRVSGARLCQSVFLN